MQILGVRPASRGVVGFESAGFTSRVWKVVTGLGPIWTDVSGLARYGWCLGYIAGISTGLGKLGSSPKVSAHATDRPVKVLQKRQHAKLILTTCVDRNIYILIFN